MQTAPVAPLLLTQAQINAAVSPETYALYVTLHDAGVLPEDETRGSYEAYQQRADQVAGDLPRSVAMDLSDAVTALAAESFAEGFARGVAFIRWLAERPDPAQLAACAPSPDRCIYTCLGFSPPPCFWPPKRRRWRGHDGHESADCHGHGH